MISSLVAFRITSNAYVSSRKLIFLTLHNITHLLALILIEQSNHKIAASSNLYVLSLQKV